jgi:hypothetical protein
VLPGGEAKGGAPNVTRLLVRLPLKPYLFDPCEPTHSPPGAGPGGFGSLPASPCW